MSLHLQTISNFRHHQSERNTKLVLSEILLRGPLPRTEIAQRVGITQASVSRITRNLLNVGLIQESGQFLDDPKPGRRRIGIEIRPDGGYFAGIAINAFQQDVVISNIANKTVAERSIRFSELENPQDVLNTCAQALIQLIEESGIDRDLLVGCGVTITGAIDPVRGRLRHAPTLGWSDVDVAAILGETLDLPVVIESIPNAKNLAARCFGPAKHVNNVMLFNCSLAIGSSMVIDGNLLRGTDSNVGLIESLLIPDAESAGALKPLDSVAGGYSIIGESALHTSVERFRMAQKLMEVIRLDSNQIAGTHRSLEQAGRGLAHAIMNANSFLHPQLFLLSGPLIESSIYRNAIVAEAARLVDQQFADSKIEFLIISSQEAAHSLAIYHFLYETGLYRNTLLAGGRVAA